METVKHACKVCGRAHERASDSCSIRCEVGLAEPGQGAPPPLPPSPGPIDHRPIVGLTREEARALYDYAIGDLVRVSARGTLQRAVDRVAEILGDQATDPRPETPVLRPEPGALEAVLARRGVASTPGVLESMRDAYDIGKLQARVEYEAAQVSNGELLDEVLAAVREETGGASILKLDVRTPIRRAIAQARGTDEKGEGGR